MAKELTDEESQLLVQGLRSLGPGGAGPAVGFVAKRLRADVFETMVSVELPFAEAIDRVRGLLSEVGVPVDEKVIRDGHRLRAMVGSGGMNLNPTVVTVQLSEAAPSVTRIHVRGVAKEGLIKQRAGRKAAERVAGLLQGT